jgi:hypothetical protein
VQEAPSVPLTYTSVAQERNCFVLFCMFPIGWPCVAPKVQEPCKGAETDSRAKFGKETVAGAHRRPKWAPHYGAQADSGRAQDAQALLRLGQALLRL